MQLGIDLLERKREARKAFDELVAFSHQQYQLKTIVAKIWNENHASKDDFFKVLTHIIQKIIAHPREDKFRRILVRIEGSNRDREKEGETAQTQKSQQKAYIFLHDNLSSCVYVYLMCAFVGLLAWS